MNKINIIKSNGKWGIYKPYSKRTIRIFKFRDVAFAVALRMVSSDTLIIVHNEDGTVCFTMLPAVINVVTKRFKKEDLVETQLHPKKAK
jgi:hypothetical protein